MEDHFIPIKSFSLFCEWIIDRFHLANSSILLIIHWEFELYVKDGTGFLIHHHVQAQKSSHLNLRSFYLAKHKAKKD